MTPISAQLDAHRRALVAVGDLLSPIRPSDLPRDTPCGDWTLAELLAHMVGQNFGFAAAVRDGDAPLEAFAPRPVSADGLVAAWDASVDDLNAAFADAAPDSLVRLVEVRENPIPFSVVLGFQIVDTVIHGWDVAHALGSDYRPDDELVEISLAVAEKVPDGQNRLQPGASFAPGLPASGDDRWARTLTLLGRRP
jgi:uncharacterized protein (TIGR03086 family)